MSDPSGIGWLALHAVRMEGDETRVYEQGHALARAAARYRPWLLREALTRARGNKARARRMARRALERLMEWDVTRFSAGDDAYLRRALVQALVQAMGARVRRDTTFTLVHRIPNRSDT